MEKLQVQDDLWLACSMRRHGLDKWEMVADEFSKIILNYRGSVLNISPVECQIKYENLKKRFQNLYQINFNEEVDDESAFVKLMADLLKDTYKNILSEEFKLCDASTEKTLHNLCILEAEKRIGDEEKGDDTSNDKMDNIHPDFIEVLDVLRSHKYCSLFESRLPSQENNPKSRYTKQIKQHMDLQIIQNKLEQGVYSHMRLASFFRDLLLMFNNAMAFYPKDTLQYSAALELKAIVVKEMGKKPLFRREIVIALPAIRNPMLAKQKLERKMRNKARGDGKTCVKRSVK